jgi:hypothetical protein
MWPNRQQKIAEISSTLEGFSQSQHRLRGIAGRHARDTLALQMVASLRRLDFTRILKNRDVSSERANPNSDAFDPERAAILLARNGELDEAIWMIFLATHFGRHKRHGWRMLRDVYSGMGTEPCARYAARLRS